jgi:uncharacterized protein (TIGR00369 family)
MTNDAVQDRYPDDFAHCYGCGRLNVQGLHVRSRWDGDETVARLTPRPEHVALPGFVYGGLLASLIDCHGIGSAALAEWRAAGDGGDVAPRFVTAALQVDFLRPTPLGPELEARGRIVETTARKVVVEVTVLARGEACVRGRVVAVPVPRSMLRAAGTRDDPRSA